MVQSGEKILFAADQGNGQVEVHVQIFYQGDADSFAWVVPVVSEPELGVGINETFAQLEQTTSPVFNIEWVNEGVCEGGLSRGAESDGDFDSAGAAPEEPSVRVVSRQDVGPYDASVLDSNDAEALIQWLADNGYRLDPSMRDVIETYVAENHLFVALRLQSDRETGEIQPLILRFSEARPCIPLRLTAIAAVPDMPVRAWLLGPARGIPMNYRHVRINWAAVDWLNYGANYVDVVRRAANEAGGNAFVTDYAGSSKIMHDRLWWSGRFDLNRLRSQTDPAGFMQEIINQGFPASGQIQALLERHMPVPQALLDKGYSAQDFYNCVECYRVYMGVDYEWDPEALADAIESAIVLPLRDAQALFMDHAVLTRLDTYISPDEMTIDPILSFNPDLPDVSNQHNATATMYCGRGGGYGTSSYVFDLPENNRVVVHPNDDGWYQWPGTKATPAAAIVEQLAEQGSPSVVTEVPPVRDPLPEEANLQGCACAVQRRAGSATGGFIALALSALALARRARRRR